jgi:nucleotide-binding universal stress UspA family protein
MAAYLEAQGASDTGATEQAGSSRHQATPDDCKCYVVGYKLTDSARNAVTWALHELPSGGKLVIVHACGHLHVPYSQLSSSCARGLTGRGLIDELLLDGDEALSDVDLLTETSDADPVTALIGSARCHAADAIVVGANQHSRVHAAMRTVSDELLERSPVPVIAVPLWEGSNRG